MVHGLYHQVISATRRIRSSHLGSLASHFPGTSQGAVDLSSQQGDGQVDGEVLQGGQVHLVLQGGAGAEEVELLAVHTLQHGELGTELGNIGLGGHLDHVGLTAVNDQLHSTNLFLLKYQHFKPQSGVESSFSLHRDILQAITKISARITGEINIPLNCNSLTLGDGPVARQSL